MSEITYALAGEAPDDYWNWDVIDLDTGAALKHVVEVNTSEGWLIQNKQGADGMPYLDGETIAQERIAGRFELRRRTQ